MQHKVRYILARIAGLLITVLLLVVVLLQAPFVQTRLAKYAAEKLEQVCDARIRLGAIKIYFPGTVVIKDIAIVDKHPMNGADTLFYAGTVAVSARIDWLLRGKGLHFARARVENAGLQLVSEPEGANIKRIFGFHANPDKKEPKDGNVFDISKVRVNNFRFRLKNFRKTDREVREHGINWADIDLTTSITGHDMHFTDNIMYGVCDHCSIYERNCDYNIHNVSGSCRIGKGMSLVENISFTDEWSDLQLEYYSMEYPRGRAFANFLQEVRLKGLINGGNIALHTIEQFSGAFDGNGTDCEIRSGRVDGYVCDLFIKGLDFTDRNSGISGLLDGRITGLPDMDRFRIDATLQNTGFTGAGLGKFLSAFSGKESKGLSSIAPGQTLTLSAMAKGPVNDLDISASVASPSGGANADIKVRNAVNKQPIMICGTLGTDRLDLSKAAGIKGVGEVTLDGRFSSEFAKGNPGITFDSLRIASISFGEGDFKDILIKGGLKDRKLDVNVSGNDPGLKLNVKGGADLGDDGKINGVELTGTINNVNLRKIGIGSDIGIESLSAKISANVKDNGDRTPVGTVDISDLLLRTKENTVNAGTISLNSTRSADRERISLRSGIIDADFDGDKSPLKFLDELKATSLERHLSAVVGNGNGENEEYGDYRLSANIHNNSTILGLLLPYGYIADSTRLRINLNRHGIVKADLSSPGIGYRKLQLRKADISMDNIEGSLNAFVVSNEIKAAGMAFRNSIMNLSVKDNTFNTGLVFDNSENDRPAIGNLNLNGNLSRNAGDSLVVSLRPYGSYFTFGDRKWSLNGNGASLCCGNIKVDRLQISDGEEYIDIDGGWARTGRDTLDVVMNDFALSFFDRLLGLNMDAIGKCSGVVTVTSPISDDQLMSADIECSDTGIAGVDFGEFRIFGNWSNEEKKFNATLLNISGDRNVLTAIADYKPSTKNFNADLNLDRMNIKIVQPFLSKTFSDMGGYIRGDFNISGAPHDLVIKEENACLDSVMLQIAYTGVRYFLNGDIDMNNDEILLNRISVSDDSDGTGTVQGKLKLKKSGKADLSARLDFKDIKIIDTPQKSSTPVYGTLLASGGVDVNGPLDNLHIDADITADKHGELHVPLNTSLIGSTSDLLTFVSLVDYEAPLDDGKSANPGGKARKSSAMDIRADIKVSKEINAWIEIDKTTGNTMKVNGDGDVRFSFNTTKGAMKMNGRYSINDGNYHFVLPGLLEKDFKINKGSSISLGGSIRESSLDISATHIVKTSISTLLMDTTAVSSRKNVDCMININGRLNAPKLDFDINVPDLDPSTRSMVEGALNTEDKKQKQFMSLLLLGMFMPAEESGVVNGSNMLYSNVGEIMSGQVNSIFQKLNIPVDVGFGYQQSIKGGNMYDVALSTQLFNNRVLVNGSVGNRDGKGTSSSNFVGDIDVQVKLDKAGRFRFNAFSHSADEYTSFLDNTQRSGLGLSWQKEFSSFRELFQSDRRKKNVKEEKRTRIKVN